MRLTRIHVGSAPGDAQAYVHLFARDLTALAGSRMLCLHERIELPASGMKGLKFEVGSIELLPAALQCAAQAARMLFTRLPG